MLQTGAPLNAPQVSLPQEARSKRRIEGTFTTWRGTQRGIDSDSIKPLLHFRWIGGMPELVIKVAVVGCARREHGEWL